MFLGDSPRRYPPGVLAQEYLEDRGFEVEVVHADPHKYILTILARASNEFVCGDGRNPVTGAAWLGSLWAVMALKTGGDINGYRKAQALLNRAGFSRIGVHGDSKGDFTCVFLQKWKSKSLDGVYAYELGKGEEYTPLSTVYQVSLPGNHQERRLAFNLIAGFTPIPDLGQFRVDGWVAPRLGISLESLLDVTAQTVQQASQVRDVLLIVP